MARHILIVIALACSGSIAVASDVTSEPVSTGRGDYSLTYAPDQGLRLRKVDIVEGKDVSSSRPVANGDGSPISKQGEVVVDIALSRWAKKSLVGVVHSRNEREGEVFTFVTIDDPDSDTEIAHAIAAKAFSCERGHRIMALSGNRRGDAITLVVARLSTIGLGGVDTGKILFHGCPNPAPVDGRVGTFTVEYGDWNPPDVSGGTTEGAPQPDEK